MEGADMSVEIMSLVYHWTFGDPVTKAIALKLADWADETGGNIFPSIKTIARMTEYSERTVQGHIKKLMEAQVLRLQRRGGGKATNLYQFTPDWKLKAQTNRYTIQTAAATRQDHSTPAGAAGEGCRSCGGTPAGAAGEGCRSCGGGVQELRGNHHLTVNEPRARERAKLHKHAFKRDHETGATAEHTIRHGDAMWTSNLDTLRKRGRPDLAEAAERTGQMITVASKWLTETGPLPRVR